MKKKKGEDKKMPRAPAVTRTITVKLITALSLNTVTGDTTNTVYTLATRTVNEQKLLKVIKEKYETKENKIVYITSVSETKKLYKMSEDEFITHAIELVPESKKRIGE